jgi:serine/threonine protein phosphatase PrpC
MITCYPETFTKAITKSEEFLLLGCDGLYELMSNQDLCKFIKQKLMKGVKLAAILEELLDKCCANNT